MSSTTAAGETQGVVREEEAWVAAIKPDPYGVLHTAMSTSRCALQHVSDLHCAATDDRQLLDYVQQNARVLAKSPSALSIRRKSSAGRLAAQPSIAMAPVTDVSATVLPVDAGNNMSSPAIASKTQHTVQLFQPEKSNRLVTRVSYAKEYFGEAYKEEYDREIQPRIPDPDSASSGELEVPLPAVQQPKTTDFEYCCSNSNMPENPTEGQSLTQFFCGGSMEATTACDTKVARPVQPHSGLVQARPASLVVVGTLSTLMDSFAALDTPGPLIRPRQLQVHAELNVPQGSSLSEYNSTYARARSSSAAAAAGATQAAGPGSSMMPRAGCSTSGSVLRAVPCPDINPFPAYTARTSTGGLADIRRSLRHVSPAHARAPPSYYNESAVQTVSLGASPANRGQAGTAAASQGSPSRPPVPKTQATRSQHNNDCEAHHVGAGSSNCVAQKQPKGSTTGQARLAQLPQTAVPPQLVTSEAPVPGSVALPASGAEAIPIETAAMLQQVGAASAQPRPPYAPPSLSGLQAILAATCSPPQRCTADVQPVSTSALVTETAGEAAEAVLTDQHGTYNGSSMGPEVPQAPYGSSTGLDTWGQQNFPSSTQDCSYQPRASTVTSTVDACAKKSGRHTAAADSSSTHCEHHNSGHEQLTRTTHSQSCHNSTGGGHELPSTPPRPRGRPPLPNIPSPSQSTDSITSTGSPARYAASRGAASYSLLRSSRDPSPVSQRPAHTQTSEIGHHTPATSRHTSRDTSPHATSTSNRATLTEDLVAMSQHRSREVSGSGIRETSSQCLHPPFVPVQALGQLRASNPGWQPFASSPEPVLLPRSSSQPGFLPPINAGSQGGSRRTSRDPSPAAAVDLRARRSICRSRDPSPTASRAVKLEQEHSNDLGVTPVCTAGNGRAAGSRSGSTTRGRLSTDPGVAGTSHAVMVPCVPGMRAGLQREMKNAAHEILDGPAWRPNGVLQRQSHHDEAAALEDGNGLGLPRLLPHVKAATLWVQAGSMFHVLADEPLPHDVVRQ